MITINIESWMNYGNGQKVALLPELEPEPIEVKVDLTHDGNGCLDFDSVLRTLERAAQEHWGLQLPLLPGAKQDDEFMNQVKQAIIDDTILVLPDILETFDFYPEGLAGEMIPCHIPVKMKGSGMVVSIWGCVGEGGGYDLGGLVKDLEESYREMLFLPAGYEVFSDSQRNVIRANGTKWIEKLKEDYRNHLADKLGYNKEPEYQYVKTKKYKFQTPSVTFLTGITPHGFFTLRGTISIVRNKLDVSVMVYCPAKNIEAAVTFWGSAFLLKNGKEIARRGFYKKRGEHWPKDKDSNIALGSASFDLEPPDPKVKWQLKFEVAYFHAVPGGGAPQSNRADDVISIDAKWIKFSDVIWDLRPEYEWLRPLFPF